MKLDKATGLICPECNKPEVYVYHRNQYCKVAGSLSFIEDATITICNVKDCPELNCENCGYTK